MKPTIHTPSTLILGCYVGNQHAAIVGSLRDAEGALRPGIVEQTGRPWAALAQALAEAEVIGAAHVVVLSNDAGMVQALTRPFSAPVGGERQRVWIGVRGNGAFVEVDLGDAAHWDVLRWLGLRWGGCFAVQRVESLPNAQALWESTVAKGADGEGK